MKVLKMCLLLKNPLAKLKKVEIDCKYVGYLKWTEAKFNVN